ncbi:MAG: DNA-binding protein YbiB [Zoogloeaceae bacterium]|jgi:anthranilate phosphoribosyltransferase|nr:DNA-binding protein YbiB [Zoogloeaceae bacterium]
MNFSPYIREIGRGAKSATDLDFEAAERLYAAILDGGVPELELGALLIALRMKGETPTELGAFLHAVEARSYRLERPLGEIRPVVLPSYNGARRGMNLTPLLALLLQRFGVPVLVHGLIEGFGRTTSAQVFRELGISPAVNLQQAQQRIEQEGLTFAPLSVFSPALAEQLALRARLGLRHCAHTLVKLLDPFISGQGVLMAAATHPGALDKMREVLLARGQTALLSRATEGEPFANPLRRPCIEFLHAGTAQTLFAAERNSIQTLPHLPETADAKSTAQWIEKALEKKLPLPLPLTNQLVCCLYASNAARDLNEARARVAASRI